MNQKRTKIIIASFILAAAMAYLVVAGVKDTSMRHFTPDALVAHAQEVHNKGIQVDGLIAEGTTQWDPTKFQLTFAVRDREGQARSTSSMQTDSDPTISKMAEMSLFKGSITQPKISSLPPNSKRSARRNMKQPTE